MTSKERMMLALRREIPDRLPATVHQWQDYHLKKYLDGIDALSAFRRFGLDASITTLPLLPFDSSDWREEFTTVDLGPERSRRDITVTTPEGTLTYSTETNAITTWVTDHIIKQPDDIHLIDKYMPVPRLDHDTLSGQYDQLGDDGIMRGLVIGHQGGCWQDACELYGLQQLIMATFDRPDWLHELLRILANRKLRFIAESMPGAKYDLIETGGGASSSTCISPAIFKEFCLPYDRQQHDALHELGLPVVYHTCGGMMPILDMIVENGCDASETLTPPGMGGDARHAEIKQQIGDKVCLIGGLNQSRVLDQGSKQDVEEEVSRLFAELGTGGGYIISPSDHFFDSSVQNIEWYAQAARACVY